MKRRRVDFELLFLLSLIAVGAWVFHSDVEAPLIHLSWEQHFEQGTRAIAAGDLTTAQRHLLRARGLAKGFPAGDDRLARTLDELGHLYFNADDYPRSMHHQANAVAALLLAKGPSDPRVAPWVSRYLWAKSRTSDGISWSNQDPIRYPHDFLLAYQPLTGQVRHQRELNSLVAVYKIRGDRKALAILEDAGAETR